MDKLHPDDLPMVLHMAATLCATCEKYIMCLIDDAPMLTCCCYCGAKLTPKGEKEMIQ